MATTVLRTARALTLGAAVFALGACAAAPEGELDPSAEGFDESADEVRAATDYFYTVRRDTRRCAAPRCGGYYFSRAGYRTSRCADGSTAEACYVSSIATPGLTGEDRERVLSGARGDRVNMVVFGRLERAGATATSAWIAPEGSGPLTGTLRQAFRPRCAPNARCTALTSRPLSREEYTALSRVDFGAAPGTDAELDAAERALTTPAGVIATGRITRAGGVPVLEASQYLLPVVAPPASARVCGAALTSALTRASEGLLMLSESDYPFTVESRPGAGAEPLTVARFRAVFSVPASQRVEVRTVASLFDWPSTDRVDMSDEERATAEKFRALVATLREQLPDAQVFRVGAIQVHTYVVGRTACGDIAGVKTILIET